MNNKLAFTFVEIIVSITIISLLSAIGFVGFTSFISKSRDTNRVSQVAEMYDGLVKYQIDNAIPIPDNYIEIKRGNKLVGYQGNIGKNILKKIGYSSEGLDPKDKTYFTYGVTKNKKSFSLITLLEESTDTSIDTESTRLPYTEGKKVGILLNNDNIPIQEIPAINSSGTIDLLSTGTNQYKLYIDNDEIYTGTGGELVLIDNNYSCKRIKDLNPGSENGIQFIDPDGDKITQPVYCNMEVEDGGWSLVLKADGNNTTFSYDAPYWTNNITFNENDYKYDLKEFKSNLFSNLKFSQILLELNTSGDKQYIIITQDGNSLEELFNGPYIATEFGRQKWKDLVLDSSMQLNCNLEGINTTASNTTLVKTRIGIISNEQNDCSSPDSRLGIGGQNGINSLSVGNVSGTWSPDNGVKDIVSFGYIYIR